MSDEPQGTESLKSLGVYLTAAQVGALLQVSDASVYRLVEEDPTMPVLRLGGAAKPDIRGRRPRGLLRFPRERLLVWLKSREQGLARARRQSREPMAGKT